jgi:hypothetical protein
VACGPIGLRGGLYGRRVIALLHPHMIVENVPA